MEKKRASILSRKASIVVPTTPNWYKRNLSPDTRSGVKYAIVWMAYVVIGSWFFLFLERTTTTVQTDEPHWSRYKELTLAGHLVEELYELQQSLREVCPHPHFNKSVDELLPSRGQTITYSDEKIHNESVQVNNPPIDWVQDIETACQDSLKKIEEIIQHSPLSMVDAIYYTMTLVTTIGYGHIYPTTRVGRMFSVIFALVGVPLTCILMAKNSKMLSDRMLQLYESAKERYSGHPKTLLYGITWIYLSLGFIVFMFLPSLFFVWLEGWSYDESLYYTFITLTTIGFGEYVAAYGEPTSYSDTYKMAVVIWIMIALGYWVLLLNFLQKAIKSNVPKRIRRTFTSKKIAKQAEFLTHLIAKVRQNPEELQPARQRNDSQSVMAFMVEVAETVSREGSVVPGSRRQSLVPYIARSRRQSMKESFSEGEPLTISPPEIVIEEPPVTFADLMKVSVVLRDKTMPAFMSLLSKAAARRESSVESANTNKTTGMEYDGAAEGPCNKTLRSSEEKEQETVTEVTLSLHDVLEMVFFCASLEQSGEVEELLNFPSHRSPAGIKESAPHLREMFTTYKRKLSLCRLIPSNSYREDISLETALQNYWKDDDDEDDDTDAADEDEYGVEETEDNVNRNTKLIPNGRASLRV